MVVTKKNQESITMQKPTKKAKQRQMIQAERHNGFMPGQQFNKLTVIDRIPSNALNNNTYVCRCACGNYIVTQGCFLVNGKLKSCGCTHPQKLYKVIKHNRHSSTHTKLYTQWLKMKRAVYPMCTEWEDFTVFQEWALANSYTEDKFLYADYNQLPLEDRIHSPKTCRWITAAEKESIRKKNARTARLNCSRRYAQKLRQKQLQRGAGTKVKNYQYFYKDQVSHTIAEWADILQLPYITVSKRLANTDSGTMEEAFSNPYKGRDLIAVLDNYLKSHQAEAKAV